MQRKSVFEKSPIKTKRPSKHGSLVTCFAFIMSALPLKCENALLIVIIVGVVWCGGVQVPWLSNVYVMVSMPGLSGAILIISVFNYLNIW